LEQIKNSISKLLNKVRDKNPLIHNITNYVTVNDCANITLAIGGSPIMADAIEEVAEIVAISNALVFNIGSLKKNTAEIMLTAGRQANSMGVPIVLDPVGVGASKLRNSTVKALLDNLNIAVIRGNLSEISCIAGENSAIKGVDVSQDDIENIDGLSVAKMVAKKYNCVVAMTGATDIIATGNKAVLIKNGHKMLADVTGTGCMSSALVGAFCGATDDYFIASVAGISTMGIAGEIAFENAGNKGTGSFHIEIINGVSLMTAQTLKERVNIYEA